MTGSSWRLAITHKTGFTYAGKVGASYNEARMSPRNEARQAVLDARLEVWPPAARTYRYEDRWGTIVTAFDVQTAHESLQVTAAATVETLPAGNLLRPAGDPVGAAGDPVGPAGDPLGPAGDPLGPAGNPLGALGAGGGASWADLAMPGNIDRWHELLLCTPRTTLDEELTELAGSLRAEHPTPHAAAMAVCERVRGEVAYETGATGVQTDAVQAWRQRKGVCQDISHLVVGLLRAMGTPARYVSGYLHPCADAAIGESVVGQSHAWVEWWVGRWTAFDPTNGIPVAERHVVVGRGREYADVPPLKGVYSGPENIDQGVEVSITRLR